MKTAEFVSPRHPDKMCDQISDAILDWCLHQDSEARVAVETMGGHGKVVVMGEITMKNGIEIFPGAIEGIVREVTGKDDLIVESRLVQQSREIAGGVDTGGAGDQGIMVGYACNDNVEMIPREAYLARSLNKYIFAKHPFDGKTQITLDDNGVITTIVASFQNVSRSEIEDLVDAWVKEKGVTPSGSWRIHANPAGDWSQGGFDADTGLTGRKLAVDNYGVQIPIGGGCFSGKDSTKVDRSGAYMARRVAVDILKATDAKEVLVKIAYAIGVAEPVMVHIEANYGEGLIPLKPHVLNYNLTPKGIIEELKLRAPQFQETAKWGHFGNGFTWDR